MMRIGVVGLFLAAGVVSSCSDPGTLRPTTPLVVTPVTGEHAFEVHHPNFPEQDLTIELPEYIHIGIDDKEQVVQRFQNASIQSDRRKNLARTAWTANGTAWNFRMDDPQASKELGLDISGTVSPNTEWVDFTFTVANVGPTPWNAVHRYYLIHIKPKNTLRSDLLDHDGSKISIVRNEQILPLSTLFDNGAVPTPMGTIKRTEGLEPVLIKEIRSNQWWRRLYSSASSIAITVENGINLSYNTSPNVQCIHVNVSASKLQPGESRTFRGRMLWVMDASRLKPLLKLS